MTPNRIAVLLHIFFWIILLSIMAMTYINRDWTLLDVIRHYSVPIGMMLLASAILLVARWLSSS